MGKKILKFLSDWVWQLPQNLCGIIYLLYMKLRGKLIDREDDANCVIWLTSRPGGVTLGKYIFVWYYKSNRDLTIKHEKGHYKQSCILGWLYLIVIGLPSILHAWLNDYIGCCKKHKEKYYHFYTEKWSDKLMGITSVE